MSPLRPEILFSSSESFVWNMSGMESPTKEGVCKKRAKFREILFHVAVGKFVGLPAPGTLESTCMPLLKRCPCWEGTGKKKKRNLLVLLWRTYSVTSLLMTKMIVSGKMESRFPIPIYGILWRRCQKVGWRTCPRSEKEDLNQHNQSEPHMLTNSAPRYH